VQPPVEPPAELAPLQLELAALLADRQALARAEEVGARALGVAVGSFDARALLADVLADAWADEIEPSADPITRRVNRELRRRAKREIRRRRRLSSWTEKHEASTATVATSEEVEHAARVSVLADVMPRLRARLAGDREALTLIALYERGVVQRADILRRTGMSTRAYRNANERIGYAARCLVERLAIDERERLAQVTPLQRGGRAVAA
jgi:hypothetical protein